MDPIATEWVEYGLAGLFLSAFLAATLLPMSSDIVLAGMVVGGFDPVDCVVVASFGNWAGGMTSYYLGYLGKWEWIEKWMKVEKRKVEQWHEQLQRFGVYLALVSWLPFIGDLIALALGFIRASTWKVAVLMFIGKAIRYIVIAYMAMKGLELF